MFDKRNKLAIFEFFVVDAVRIASRRESYAIGNIVDSGSVVFASPALSGQPPAREILVEDTGSDSLIRIGKTPWWVRFARWLRGWLSERNIEKARTMSVQEFFQSLKNSVEELKVVTERAVGYESALRQAKESGQKALFEKLSSNLNATRTEAQLVAAGFTKYLTEEVVVRFVKRCEIGRFDNVPRALRSNVLR